MTNRRKDNKNRVLQKGEIQRKDGIYEYRYTDDLGKRRSIYSKDLNELRHKEGEIYELLKKGIRYHNGDITVNELVEKYLEINNEFRYNTKICHNTVLNLLKNENFASKKIRDITMIDVQDWFIKLKDDGKNYSTIKNIKGVVRPAFELAYNNNWIEKNPFSISLRGIISEPKNTRKALNNEQQKLFMDFIFEDKTYSKYYNELVILLNTGLRVSEFCGLTKSDIDFEKGYIRIDHQLNRERNGKYYIEETKTDGGVRYIPFKSNKILYQSLKDVIKNRKTPRKETVVDGYSDFLFLDKNGNPKVAQHIQNEMQRALKKYKSLYPDNPLPPITPHVLRHTFCTNMANKGMNPKDLQYLMGHSDIKITLGVYTHAELKKISKDMELIFKNTD